MLVRPQYIIDRCSYSFCDLVVSTIHGLMDRVNTLREAGGPDEN